jgi:hypothetical protein
MAALRAGIYIRLHAYNPYNTPYEQIESCYKRKERKKETKKQRTEERKLCTCMDRSCNIRFIKLNTNAVFVIFEKNTPSVE